MLLSELCLPLLTSWAKNFTVAKAQIPPSDREGPPAQMVWLHCVFYTHPGSRLVINNEKINTDIHPFIHSFGS